MISLKDLDLIRAVIKRGEFSAGNANAEKEFKVLVAMLAELEKNVDKVTKDKI